MAPPITTVPLSSCLKESLAAAQDHRTGSMKAGSRLVTMSMARSPPAHRLASAAGDSIGPGAGGIPPPWRLDRTDAGLDPPHRAGAASRSLSRHSTSAPSRWRACGRLGGAERIGAPVAPRDHAARA